MVQSAWVILVHCAAARANFPPAGCELGFSRTVRSQPPPDLGVLGTDSGRGLEPV